MSLQRARASAEAYQRQMKQVPKVILDQFHENESAVRILDSLVPKLDEVRYQSNDELNILLEYNNYIVTECHFDQFAVPFIH